MARTGRPVKIKDRVEITLSLESDLLRCLDWFSRCSGVSRAEIIRTAVKNYVGGVESVKTTEK